MNSTSFTTASSRTFQLWCLLLTAMSQLALHVSCHCPLTMVQLFPTLGPPLIFIVCASPSEILHTLLSLFYGKTFTNHLLTKLVKQCVNKQFMSFPGPSSPLSWPGITHLLSHACFQEHHDTGFDRNCDFPPAALEMLLQGSSKSWLFSPFV